MASRGIRRKFGQNYLSDPAIIFEMGQAISPLVGDNFFEIGPGDVLTGLIKRISPGAQTFNVNSSESISEIETWRKGSL